MGTTDNPLFGRKIFFLNPPLAIKSTGISKLRAQEYEAYIIEDYRYAKSILKQNKDALVFIDIDGVLSENEWFNFIKSFEEDEILSSVDITILSQNLKFANKYEHFFTKSTLHNFLQLTDGIQITMDKIIDICKDKGAKGRRQYIRLSCKSKKDAIIYAEKNGKLYNMKLIDISSVGFACSLSLADKDTFKEKEAIPSILISFDTKSLNCEAVVYAVKQTQNECIIVMLLMPNTPNSIRTGIRNWIFQNLQDDLDFLISDLPKDKTDYSILNSTK